MYPKALVKHSTQVVIDPVIAGCLAFLNKIAIWQRKKVPLCLLSRIEVGQLLWLRTVIGSLIVCNVNCNREEDEVRED